MKAYMGFAAVIDYASDVSNLLKIKLQVVEKKETAIDLYKSFGFKAEGKPSKHFL